MIWLAVLACGVGCYLLKLAGMSVPEWVLAHPVLRRTADLLPVVLLAALVAVQTLVVRGPDGLELFHAVVHEALFVPWRLGVRLTEEERTHVVSVDRLGRQAGAC